MAWAEMKALGITLSADDYFFRYPAWFIDEVILYEGVKNAYDREQAN